MQYSAKHAQQRKKDDDNVSSEKIYRQDHGGTWYGMHGTKVSWGCRWFVMQNK